MLRMREKVARQLHPFLGNPDAQRHPVFGSEQAGQMVRGTPDAGRHGLDRKVEAGNLNSDNSLGFQHQGGGCPFGD